jgi:hypothetical protein
MNRKEKELRAQFPRLILGRAYDWGGIHDSDKEAMGRFAREAPLRLVAELTEQIRKGNDQPYYTAQRYLENPNANEFSKYRK